MGPPEPCSSRYGSRYSMSRTCGPRDIISYLSLKVGDNTAFGVFLSMDLTHAHIPMGDGTFKVLYSRERADKHVTDPNGPDYRSEDEFDEVPDTIEYNPHDFPFMKEDSIDMLLPRTNEYKEKLAKFQGKEPWSIQIMKKEDEEHKEAIKRMVNVEPPSYPYNENIPYINFSEGCLALMWDKKKGKPKHKKK
jgi:hypothetical protein